MLNPCGCVRFVFDLQLDVDEAMALTTMGHVLSYLGGRAMEV